MPLDTETKIAIAMAFASIIVALRFWWWAKFGYRNRFNKKRVSQEQQTPQQSRDDELIQRLQDGAN